MSDGLAGMEQMKGRLSQIANNVPGRTGAALVRMQKEDKEKMQERTPVKDGDLRDSATVEGPFFQGPTISAEVRMGEGLPYALEIHENTSMSHRVGQAKFMESVVKESENTMNGRLAQELRVENFL